jgi:hypothetical protein
MAYEPFHFRLSDLCQVFLHDLQDQISPFVVFLTIEELSPHQRTLQLKSLDPRERNAEISQSYDERLFPSMLLEYGGGTDHLHSLLAE